MQKCNCRVSTDGQTLDAQIAELKAAGATRLFAEKQSGARSDRPQLRKALAALGEGGVLMVTRLDRLARSTRDLLNVLHEVAESGAAFKSLHDAWADTTTPHGRLILTILGGLAEFERSLIKARTDVGIKRAREAGIKFGRPSKLTKHQQEQALKLAFYEAQHAARAPPAPAAPRRTAPAHRGDARDCDSGCNCAGPAQTRGKRRPTGRAYAS